jgi:hypothetical protein
MTSAAVVQGRFRSRMTGLDDVPFVLSGCLEQNSSSGTPSA